MDPCRMNAREIRQLSRLMNALLEDSDLMAQLSVIQSEQIRGAGEVLRSLFEIVDRRDLDDALNDEG